MKPTPIVAAVRDRIAKLLADDGVPSLNRASEEPALRAELEFDLVGHHMHLTLVDTTAPRKADVGPKTPAKPRSRANKAAGGPAVPAKPRSRAKKKT